jgi:glycosyltransferase involved in cell wall biosynthesis
MRVVFLSPWYSEKMGYTENMFPKAMAKLDAEVHLLSSNAQINYHHPHYDALYKKLLGPRAVECGVKQVDGYTLHRLPLYETKNPYEGPGIKNLYEYLLDLRPDVIQTFEIGLETTYEGARYAADLGCKFFTECHIHASVFRKDGKKSIRDFARNIRNAFSKKLKMVNNATSICYPIAEDAAEIAMEYYRVPRKKIKVQSLGVDTDLFFPTQSEREFLERRGIREKFGFADSDIVCIYTGRFTRDKNPQILAQAINGLVQNNYPFKGLFVGSGSEEDIEFIKTMKGCKVENFIPANQLPSYYWAADVGVWPREESTSQLDAAACGLPLVLSDRIKVLERVEGNGLLYDECNAEDLGRQLLKLQQLSIRKEMSEIGVKKVIEKFSWNIIASSRIKDYKMYLKNGIGIS